MAGQEIQVILMALRRHFQIILGALSEGISALQVVGMSFPTAMILQPLRLVKHSLSEPMVGQIVTTAVQRVRQLQRKASSMLILPITSNRPLRQEQQVQSMALSEEMGMIP